MKIAFIGLGNMGLPMAQNLLQAGYELTVYNRTKDKAQPLIEQGARFANSAREAAQECGIAFTMLSDDAALEAIVLGPDGLLAGLPEQGIHISASTISVEMSRKLSAAHEANAQHFISAAVLGRPDAAKAAKLRILLAGDEKARQRVVPILETLGQQIFVLGDQSESGNAVKISINFLLASMLEALSESQLMAEKYGVAPKDFFKVVNALFQSPVYQNYSAIMAERRFEPAGFTMKLGAKDVKLALDAAKEVHTPLPLGELINKHYTKGIQSGYGEQDWTALIRCLEDMQNQDNT